MLRCFLFMHHYNRTALKVQNTITMATVIEPASLVPRPRGRRESGFGMRLRACMMQQKK